MTPYSDLAQRLIRSAARSAPPALAERLAEEWSADLAARTGTFARLRLAVGCWWAMGVITRELAMPQVAASSAAGGVRTLLGGLHCNLPLLSRRTVTFVTIAAVHVLLIYVFTIGLAQHVLQSLPPATRAVFMSETLPQRQVPPVPTIDVKTLNGRIDPQIPAPPSFEFPPQTDTGPEVVTGPEVIDALPQTPPVLHRQLGGPGSGFPNPDDFYPAAARRLAQTGTTTVQVCVDTQGRLARDPLVTQSSGIVRLDDGAMKLAKAGSGHYRPTTENGQPVSSCYPYRIRFRLDD